MTKQLTILTIFTMSCLGCDRGNDRIKQLETENEALKKEISQLRAQKASDQNGKAPAVSAGPGSALKHAILAANDGKYSIANECMSSQNLETVKKVGGGNTNWMWENVTAKGTIKDVEITKDEVRGEGAEVSFKITYKSRLPVELKEDMFQENGTWRTSFFPLGFEAVPKFKYFEPKLPNSDRGDGPGSGSGKSDVKNPTK